MSTPDRGHGSLPHHESEPADPASPSHTVRLTAAAIFTAIAATVFVDIHVLAMAGAIIAVVAVWLKLGAVASAVLGSVVGAPALWVCYLVARLALDAERRQLAGEA